MVSAPECVARARLALFRVSYAACVAGTCHVDPGVNPSAYAPLRSAVPVGWEHLCPEGWTLSDIQRAGIAAVASGRDVLTVAATGSGKSLIFLLPAIARWAEAIELDKALPPVALLVVPYIGLAESQLASTERLLHCLCEAGRLRRRPRALFVRRTLPGTDDDAVQPSSSTPAPGPVAIGGGCRPDRAPKWVPQCFPCEMCDGCREDANDSTTFKSAGSWLTLT